MVEIAVSCVLRLESDGLDKGGKTVLLGAANRIPGGWRDVTATVLEEARREGFSVLNLVVDDPAAVGERDVERLKALFEEAGLLIGQTNGAYGGALVSPDEGERTYAVEFVKRMCWLTRRLGAPNTYLRPGSLNPKGAWLPHPGNRTPEVFDRLVDSARRICGTAADEGVRVAVEGGAVSPLYSARRVRDFVDAVGMPALGFNQDPVNFVGSLEDALDMPRFLLEFFDLLGDVTIGAHAKDFRVMEQLLVGFEEVEIGSGLLDHEMFLQHMQRSCPEGHVLIEHIPPDRYAAAAARYREIAARVGITWGAGYGGEDG